MSRSTAISTIIIVITAVFISGCSQSERKVRLRFNYQPGLELTYLQTSKRHVRLLSGDSLIDNYSMMATGTITQLVGEVSPDGSARVRELSVWESHPLDRWPATIAPENEVTEYEIAVLPDGKITAIKAVSGQDDTALDYIENQYRQGGPVFPEGELSPGHSWTQTTTVKLPDYTLEATTTYRITALAREAGYDCALIEYEAKMVIPVETDSPGRPGTAEFDRISGTGLIYFAYNEGLVVLQREHWTVQGNRPQLVNGSLKPFRIAMDHSLDFCLKSRRQD